MDSCLCIVTSTHHVWGQCLTELWSQMTWVKILLFPLTANTVISFSFSSLCHSTGIIANTSLSCGRILCVLEHKGLTWWPNTSVGSLKVTTEMVTIDLHNAVLCDLQGYIRILTSDSVKSPPFHR